MSKRVQIYVPDSCYDAITDFFAVQGNKGMSLAVMVTHMINIYGMEDVVLSSLSGVRSVEPVLNNSTVFEAAPKRKRGRPKKSEQSVSSKNMRAAEECQQEKEDVIQIEDSDKTSQKDIPQNISPKPAFEEKEEVSIPKSPVSTPNNNFSQGIFRNGHSEKSGWSDDAFEGIDPDFNPTGAIDDVAALFGE